MCVTTYIRQANWRFGNVELPYCYWVARVAFRAEVAFLAQVASALESAVCISRVEMHLFFYVSRVSEESSQCHVGEKGIRLCRFEKAWLGVFLSQPSPCHGPETENLSSSLLGSRRAVNWSDIAFPLLLCEKTHLRPFWAYSRQGACCTVPAVPDLLALP